LLLCDYSLWTRFKSLLPKGTSLNSAICQLIYDHVNSREAKK